jgi:hypothetical protein
MLVAKVQVSGMPVAKGQVSIMLVATADKLRLYRCSSPRERYDANFCNLVLAIAASSGHRAEDVEASSTLRNVAHVPARTAETK